MCSKRGTRAPRPNIWSLLACIVAKSKRRASAELIAARREKGRSFVARLTVARDILLSTIPIERFYQSERERERERERENVARVSSRTRLIVVVSLDFYTCDIPSLINIYLSNSRIIRTPSGPIIVVISPMLAPRPRPLVLAARFSRTAATNVRSTHRRNTSFTRLYSFSVN